MVYGSMDMYYFKKLILSSAFSFADSVFDCIRSALESVKLIEGVLRKLFNVIFPMLAQFDAEKAKV